MPKIGKNSKIIFTPSERQFMIDNFNSMTNKQIADAIGVKLTRLRNELFSLGLKRIELVYWTEEQVSFLINNYKTIGDVELAEIFESTWPKNKTWTKKHIEKKRRYLSLKRTKEEIDSIFERNVLSGRFKECNRKMWEHRGVNPIGTILFWNRKNKRSQYPVIKLESGYVFYYRWLWIQKYGELDTYQFVVPKINAPEGVLLNLEHLEVIDPITQQLRNIKRRIYYPSEIKKAIKLSRELNKILNKDCHDR